MKIILSHIALFTTIIILWGNCYAAAGENGVWIWEKNTYKKISVSAEQEKDSIPNCINEMKKMQNPTLLIEYNYKGQRWFVFSKDGSSPVSDVSGKITYTTFYNLNCRIACFWKKDETTGLNKAFPDTIEKEKIKKIRIVSQQADREIPLENVEDQKGLSTVQISNPFTSVPAVDFIQGDATFGYTARITPDGILHYKTPAKPIAAAVIFHDPVSGTYPNVNFNPKKDRRTYLVTEEKKGEYLIDISKEKFNEKHAVTLILTTAKDDSAAVVLVNRNVKAEYVHYDKSNFGHHLKQEASRESKSTFKQWKDAAQQYYIRTITGNSATPGGTETHIFLINGKGKTLKGSGIGTSIKLLEEGAKDFWRVLDSLMARLDNCKDCPAVRKPAEMDSISKAAEKFVRVGITYHLPVAGKPAYYLYAKDEYGILRLIERRFSRGCSVTGYDNERVDAFLNVFEQYEKNGTAITKAQEEGALVIKSADKDFLPGVTVAADNTLACTIWIDNAGLVHCKTDSPLFSSDIFFQNPATTITENGISRTVVPEEHEKHYTPKKISSNEYVMDVSREKIKQMSKITVILEATNGKNAMVYLFNKRLQNGR